MGVNGKIRFSQGAVMTAAVSCRTGDDDSDAGLTAVSSALPVQTSIGVIGLSARGQDVDRDSVGRAVSDTAGVTKREPPTGFEPVTRNDARGAGSGRHVTRGSAE